MWSKTKTRTTDIRVFVSHKRLRFNLLTPVPPVTGRDIIDIISNQLLQEEKIFPMMPRSE